MRSKFYKRKLRWCLSTELMSGGYHLSIEPVQTIFGRRQILFWMRNKKNVIGYGKPCKKNVVLFGWDDDPYCNWRIVPRFGIDALWRFICTWLVCELRLFNEHVGRQRGWFAKYKQHHQKKSFQWKDEKAQQTLIPDKDYKPFVNRMTSTEKA